MTAEDSARVSQRMAQIPFSMIRTIHAEADRLEASGREILHLEIGEPDFQTPEHISQAAIDAIRSGVTHYTPNAGLPALRQAVSSKLMRDNGLSYSPDDEVVITVGANEAVAATFLALLDTDDEVLVPTPSWPHYEQSVRLAGARPRFYPLRFENGFQALAEDIGPLVAARTRMLVINSPGNPTGCVLDRQVLRDLADLVERHDLLVLSDEIYEKLVFDDTAHYSFGALPGMADRTVTVNGFSKAYAMTGWRLGYVAARRNLMDAIVRAHQYTVTSAVSFAQVGAIEAMNGSQDCVTQMVGAYRRRRSMVVDALSQIPTVSYVFPTGAFYVFPRLDGVIESLGLVKALLNQFGVATVPGEAFGPGGHGHLRLSFTQPEDRLATGLPRLSAGLRHLLSGAAGPMGHLRM